MKTLTSPTAIRTTITLPLDVYEFVKTYANAKAMKLSEALADMARQTKASSTGVAPVGMIKKGESWVFDLENMKRMSGNEGKPIPKITMEQINNMLHAEYEIPV
jgi:hypothetical protein